MPPSSSIPRSSDLRLEWFTDPERAFGALEDDERA
jgi:hypothetical protein